MTLPRLRLHGDSRFFAGSENMIAVLLADPRLRKLFDADASFRAEPLYEKGLRARVPAPGPLRALPLIDDYQVSGLLDPILPRWAALGWRAACRLLLLRVWTRLWNAVVLIADLAARRPDILHVNNGGHPGASSCFAAALIGPLVARRTVLVVNNLARGLDGFDRALDLPFDALLARSSVTLVTGSRAAADRLTEALGLAPGRVRVVPNGTPARPVRAAPERVREDLGVPKGRTLALVVAVMEERKGHRVLLEALASMSPGRRPFVVLEGAGPLKPLLERRAVELGLEGDALFVGPHERVFDLMNAADLLVLPSISGEDFPNVTLEAMSLGKAVVASAVAGVPEQMDDGVHGLLAAPGDPAALAAALDRANDPALRARLGEAGKRRWAERFTPEAAAARWLALYAELL